MILLLPPRPRRVLVACCSVAALSATGCASHAQTAPTYRETAPAGSTEATVREEFDPARFREDLILIQPVFPPPTVNPGPVEPVIAVNVIDSADSVDVTIYRVQVIALRREEGARNIADELRRRFDVPTEVVPQGNLFAVHVGRMASAADARSLQAQIAALSLGYEGAFLVKVRRSFPIEEASDALSNRPAGDHRPEADLPAASLFEDGSEFEASSPFADSLAADPPIDNQPALDIEPPPEPEELVRIQGWRVLIDQFMDLDGPRGALQHRRQVMKRLKRDDVDVKFEAPWYKVLAGSFRTSTEAQKFVERCRALGYQTAAHVPGEVYLPREEEQ